MRIVLIILILIAGGVAAAVLWPAPPPVSHVYFDDAPTNRAEIIAHGGGLGVRPANTLEALDAAVSMGADVLEVDLQQTKDGVLVLMHDDTVDRTTDLSGRVADFTLAEIKKADAGAHIISDGTDFIGQGIRVPTLAEAFARHPRARWVMEIKPDTEKAARTLCRGIRVAGARQRVLVGSFHHKALSAFRAGCPEVATSMSSREATWFILTARLGVSRFISTPAVAMQVPATSAGIDIAHPRVIAAAHARGFKVQFWTINDLDEMRSLLILGADGIITDYVERLKNVMGVQ